MSAGGYTLCTGEVMEMVIGLVIGLCFGVAIHSAYMHIKVWDDENEKWWLAMQQRGLSFCDTGFVQAKALIFTVSTIAIHSPNIIMISLWYHIIISICSIYTLIEFIPIIIA